MEKTTVYRMPMGENLFEEEFTVGALGTTSTQICELTEVPIFMYVI